MIYNTTIIGGSGNRWQAADGKFLTAIGRQNIYIGKNVWTDGNIIYGYDLPGYVARKVIRKVKKIYHEIIYFVKTNGISGYNVADDRMISVYKSRSGNELVASGIKLYNVEATTNTGDPDNPYKWVFTDITGNLSVDVPAWYNRTFYPRFNGDMGRNGGFLAASSVNRYLSVQYDFIYYIYEVLNAQNQKELRVNKIELSTLYQSIQTIDSRIGSGGDMALYCLNVADDGTGTGIIEIYYNNDFYHYTFTFTPNGITITPINTPTVTVPAGDAMLTLGLSAMSGLSTIGTAVVDNNVSLIIYYYSKVTKTAEALFVLSPNLLDTENYFEFDMYDLQGNYVRSLVDSILFVYGNNFRLDLCDINAQATAWGFN